MRRRALLFAPLAAIPGKSVIAQTRDARNARIGLLLSTRWGDLESDQQIDALRDGLRRLGWIEGHNLTIESRWFAGDPQRMEVYAEELVARAPDILISRSDPALRALLRRTRTIPIVFVVVADPVGNGLIASLARPGGNATGFSNAEASLAGKFPELLRELDPRVAHITILGHPETLATRTFTPPAEVAAQMLNMTTSFAPIRNVGDIRNAIAAAAQRPPSALIVLPSIVTSANADFIVATAADHRIPAIYPFGFFARQGGLVSYGMDVPHLFREAASYADRILRGTDPGALPVQQPAKFELIINLKTADALGLTVPQAMQLRADEVIE